MTQAKRESAAGRIKASVRAFVDARGLFWSLVISAIGLLLTGGGIGALVALRDDVGDFLASDVEVWHLLLVVGTQGVAAVASVTWWARRRTVRQAVRFPREIDYLGVKWPVLAVESLSSRTITHFKVGRPMCPKCRTPLALVLTANDDEAEEDIVLPLDDDLTNGLVAERMVFQCPNDGLRHDLRAHGCGMRNIKDFVSDLAMGHYRTALAAAMPEARENR